MFRFGSAILAAMFLFAGAAIAASSADVITGPKTNTRTLNIVGVGGPGSPTNPTTGACNIDPWVDHCSGPGNCSCLEIAVSKASGNMDKGAQTVSNFFVTTDNTVNPATEPPPAPGTGPNPRCGGFLGILTDTVSATSETKTLNLAGVSCKKVIAISNANPSGTHVGDTIVGGWGISGSTPPSPDASGWGTLSGFETKATNAIALKISGLVTE